MQAERKDRDEELPEDVSKIKRHLQILSRGFSADYKNRIHLLYMKLEGRFLGGRDFHLPPYQDYIQEKSEQFQPYYPGINIKDLYYSLIDEEKLEAFNEKVRVINQMLDAEEEGARIKQECDILIRDYLSEPIDRTLGDVYASLERALSEQ